MFSRRGTAPLSRRAYGSHRVNVNSCRHLQEKERQLWGEYLEQEAAGLRTQALSTLERLIASLRSYAPDDRRAWVEDVCAEHWSGPVHTQIEGTLRLRYPLLAEVILPELLEGYRQGRPNNARWLALLSLTGRGAIDAEVYQVMRLQGMPEWYPPQLLREALTADPSDEQAAHALILYFEETFDYWTHHVPNGVLTDDTATWRTELAEFERLVMQYPTGRDFGFEVRGWRLHCDAWEEYLSGEHDSESYADFLAQRS